MSFPHGNDASSSSPALYQSDRTTLTAEEKLVLTRCNRESFWYRSLPMCIAGSVTLGMFHRAGLLKFKSRGVMLAQHCGIISVNYFFGKLLYMSVCKERILALPNSPLAERFRAYDRGSSRSKFASHPQPPDSFQRFPQTEADEFEGAFEPAAAVADGPYAPFGNSEADYGASENARPAQSSVPYGSHDALRQQNREAYEAYRRSSRVQPKPPPGRSTSSEFAESGTEAAETLTAKNQYGDTIFKF